MSYLGHAHFMTDYCRQIAQLTSCMPGFEKKSPYRPVRILEIGVDRGQTALPLLNNLTTLNIPFVWYGIDIRLDDNFAQQIMMMEGMSFPSTLESAEHHVWSVNTDVHDGSSNFFYLIGNSFEVLDAWAMFSEQVKPLEKFDLVLIDGDHNYETVSHELSHLDMLTHDYSLVVCDDVYGRHMAKDSFYVDTIAHKNVSGHKDLSRGAERQGVDHALSDYLMNTGKEWHPGTFGPRDKAITSENVATEAAFLIKPKFLDVKQISGSGITDDSGKLINIFHRLNQTYVFKDSLALSRNNN